MRGSWVLVVATVPYKHCTAKSPPASSSHRVKTHRSKNRQWLEHVDRIQVFMCPTHLREISSDVLRYFWEIIGSFFADRDETEKKQRLATSETSKLRRYILWSFEQIQIKAFLLQKIEDKACPPDTTKWVLPPRKPLIKNKNSKALTKSRFRPDRCSFFQFPRADPLDDSRWGPLTPTLTQTSGNVELQHKTSGTWKKCKHLSSRSSLLLGWCSLSRKAAVPHNRQRDTTPGPPLVLQTHRFGLERVSFHRSNLGCRWCAPSALQETVTFPRQTRVCGVHFRNSHCLWPNDLRILKLLSQLLQP